jgi:hypothetical protein
LGKVRTASQLGKVRTITITVMSVTSPPPSSNEFPQVVLFILSKTKTKNLLQEIHVIFTWLQPDLVLVLIQTCWIQISLALGFVGY